MQNSVRRVLLIEDNEAHYQQICGLFAGIAVPQFDVQWAKTYEDAHELLDKEQLQFDVCLIAHPLKGHSALEWLQEHAVSQAVPCILLAQSEEHDVDVAAAEAGAADYLLKSHINAPLLERSMRYAIERKKTETALRESRQFIQSVVDSLPETVAVLDAQGIIVAVNTAWRQFGDANGFTGASDSVGANYLKICEESGIAEGRAAAEGLRAVLSGQRDTFSLDYYCPSPTEDCWFTMRASRFRGGGPLHIVVEHENITNHKKAEAEMARLASIVESSADAIISKTLDGTITTWNAGAERLYGYSAQEAIGQSIALIIPAGQTDELPTLLAAIKDGESIPNYETVRVRKDGRHLHVSITISLLKNAAGEIIGASAIARDISKRKKLEAALHRANEESEERVATRTKELALSNASLEEEMAKREQGLREIRARARQQEAVAELGQRALSGVSLEALFKGAVALVSSTLQTEICSVLEFLPGEPGSKASWLLHASIGLLPEGTEQTEIDIPDNSPAVLTLRSGEPTIIEDICQQTQFKYSALSLHRGTVSSATVAIQGEGTPFGVLGIGSTQPRTFNQDDIHFLESIANVLATAIERKRVETEIHELNSELREANEKLRVEIVQHEMTMAVLRETAASLEKATEQARAANEAKSEFLSRMSHELRTPLNAILGFGQILEMHDDPEWRDDVQQILKAGRHLLDLINEVLDIARIEAGRLSLSQEPVPVGMIVRETLDLVRPLAANRQISLINEIRGEEAKAYILADQQRLKQVLLNLISNAVKYNRDGGQVRLSCRLMQDKPVDINGVTCEGTLRLHVSDTGDGLTPQDISRLFIPFERLSAASTRIEGTGIGLALCKRLIEALGGQIGVDSEVGRGSTFWVELPLVRPQEEQSEPVGDETFSIVDASVFDGSRTILYIEDNLSNVNVVQRALLSKKYDINMLTAMQGSVGIDLATQHQPDLILLDIHLPDIIGDVVLRRLKAHPVTRQIPIVILSADATPGQIERILEAGAMDYLTKPLDLKRFFKVLEETLKKPNGASA